MQSNLVSPPDDSAGPVGPRGLFWAWVAGSPACLMAAWLAGWVSGVFDDRPGMKLFAFLPTMQNWSGFRLFNEPLLLLNFRDLAGAGWRGSASVGLVDGPLH